MNLQKMLSGFSEIIKNFDAETINILKRMGDDMIIMQQEHIFEGKRSMILELSLNTQTLQFR